MTIPGRTALVSWLVLVACSAQEDEPVESPRHRSSEVEDEAAEGAEPSSPEPYFNLTFDMLAGLEDDRWEALPFDSLRLSRSGCYGTCPSYSVEFDRGGEAKYVGRAYVPREGEFTGRISLYSFGLLCSLAERTDLLGLEDRYSAGWTDDATVTVELNGASGSKIISDYGQQAPAEFHGYCALFDDVVEAIDWRPVAEKR